MSDKKWILVTGASTGIGRVTAELLAQQGFNVYAGARKKEDLEELDKIPNISSVKLDVTSDDDIQEFVKKIKKSGLFGIFNNAGIVFGAALMELELQSLKEQLEVNFFGVHRITKAVFPYILKEKGRIVMMSSNAGSFASPYFGPYSSSKHALEAYSDSLRRELLLHDVKVVIIRPGRIRTSIWEKGEELLVMVEGSIFNEIGIALGKSAIEAGKTDSLPPVKVAELVLKAFVAKNPKPRYNIAPNPFTNWLRDKLPDRLVDQIVKSKMNDVLNSN